MIEHIKTLKQNLSSAMNGEFRIYKEKRKLEELVSFIKQKKWETVEPVPSWKSPGSIL